MGQHFSHSLEFLKSIDGKTYIRPLFIFYKLYLVCGCIFYSENLKKLTQDCKKTTKHKSLSGSGSQTPPAHMLLVWFGYILEMQSATLPLNKHQE